MGPDPKSPKPSLSKREYESLAGRAASFSSKEVASRIGTSESAVNKYVQTARIKLGARTASEAVRMFRQGGILPPSESYVRFEGVSVAPLDQPEDAAIEDARGRLTLNDVAVDHARMSGEVNAEPTLTELLHGILKGLRPDGISFATRNVLIIASVIVAGAAFFLLSVALALVAPLAKVIRALFP
jgi:DNA-binding CsgD family transcriptional regulator